MTGPSLDSCLPLSDCYQPLLRYRHWLIAYSGGLDSTVLLHAARKFLLAQVEQGLLESELPQLSAIYIDHQLQPESAGWRDHCERFCRQYGIQLICERIKVQSDGKGLESAARAVRYAAFSRHLQGDSVLLTGHHADDQAETLLLRLLRGSGLRGVTGIPVSRSLASAAVCRPLLSIGQQQLFTYATHEGLSYIDDPSNEDLRFDRNFVRQRLLPLLEERWPAARKTLLRFSSHADEAVELLSDLAAIDAKDVTFCHDSYGAFLPLKKLLRLSRARRVNLLRYCLSRLQYTVPSAAQMKGVERFLVGGKNSTFVALADCRLCLHRQRIYFVVAKSVSQLSEEGALYWRPQTQELDYGDFSLSAARAPLGIEGLLDGEYRIASRQSGRHYVYHGQHRSLKKLLNECAIPFWRRDHYPIVYCGEEIAAVGDLLVCDNYRVEQGWQLSVQPR